VLKWRQSPLVEGYALLYEHKMHSKSCRFASDRARWLYNQQESLDLPIRWQNRETQAKLEWQKRMTQRSQVVPPSSSSWFSPSWFHPPQGCTVKASNEHWQGPGAELDAENHSICPWLFDLSLIVQRQQSSELAALQDIDCTGHSHEDSGTASQLMRHIADASYLFSADSSKFFHFSWSEKSRFLGSVVK